MLCLDVLWGAPASVLGCRGSEGTVGLVLSAAGAAGAGHCSSLATVPRISPAGHTRGDRSPGLAHCPQAVEHHCECGAEQSAAL